MIKNFPPPSV